jgi:hypothetical protein
MTTQSIRAALAAHEATRKDAYTKHRIDLAQERYEAWVDVTLLIQRYGERLTLVSVEWVEMTRAEGRTLSGPRGAAYATGFQSTGHVYARHASGGNSYGLDFESADTFTACDLLNLAAAEYDEPRYGSSNEATNPFRPFVPEGGWEANDARRAAYEAAQAEKGGRA